MNTAMFARDELNCQYNYEFQICNENFVSSVSDKTVWQAKSMHVCPQWEGNRLFRVIGYVDFADKPLTHDFFSFTTIKITVDWFITRCAK